MGLKLTVGGHRCASVPHTHTESSKTILPCQLFNITGNLGQVCSKTETYRLCLCLFFTIVFPVSVLEIALAYCPINCYFNIGVEFSELRFDWRYFHWLVGSTEAFFSPGLSSMVEAHILTRWNSDFTFSLNKHLFKNYSVLSTVLGFMEERESDDERERCSWKGIPPGEHREEYVKIEDDREQGCTDDGK